MGQRMVSLFMLIMTLCCSLAYSEDETAFNYAITEENWLNYHLKEKNAPKWVISYILALDGKIQDLSAKSYFRRFIIDPVNRYDSITKFVEYLAVAGFPESLILNSNEVTTVPSDVIYKGVYFGLTYTIMDGLPDTPLKSYSQPIGTH